MKLKKILYVEAVILLMALCFWKTALFLDINPPKVFSTANQKKQEEGNPAESIGIENSNFFQHYEGMQEFGFFANDSKNVFHVERIGNRWNLIKKELKSKEETLLFSGGRIKNLMLSGDFIYFVTTATDDEKIIKDYVCRIPYNGGENEQFYQTESDMITSMFQDENYIFYTNNISNTIYMLDKQKKEIADFCTISDESEPPILIDIYKGHLIYVDGTGVKGIDIETKAAKVFSNTITSVLQNPVSIKGNIYAFDSLAGHNIIRFNMETGKEETIVSKKEIGNIQNFSYYGNKIFLISDGHIYYKEIAGEGKLQILKEAEPQSEVFYIANDFLYTEDGIHGKLQEIPITYLNI